MPKDDFKRKRCENTKHYTSDDYRGKKDKQMNKRIVRQRLKRDLEKGKE
jgi:hypothetical protein